MYDTVYQYIDKRTSDSSIRPFDLATTPSFSYQVWGTEDVYAADTEFEIPELDDCTSLRPEKNAANCHHSFIAPQLIAFSSASSRAGEGIREGIPHDFAFRVCSCGRPNGHDERKQKKARGVKSLIWRLRAR